MKTSMIFQLICPTPRIGFEPLSFSLVIDEVTRDIHGDIPWCMLFADDVVLVDESRTGINLKLES
jgi:hypothetical protein